MDSPKSKPPTKKHKKLDKKSKNWKHDHMDLRRIKRKMQKDTNANNNKSTDPDQDDTTITPISNEKVLKLEENTDAIQTSQDSSEALASKNEKLKKTDLKNARKQEKYKKTTKGAEFFDSSIEIKKIWEDLRKIEGTKSEKGHELAEEIFQVLKKSKAEEQAGNTDSTEEVPLSEALLNYCRKHDTSRIIQGILAKGNPELRLMICKALLPTFHDLITTKYANFVAEKMLSCIANKKQRQDFLTNLADQFLQQKGTKIGKLIKDPYAGPVLEQLFSNHSTDKTKTKIKSNFYGNEFINKCERHLGGNTEKYSIENLLNEIKNEDDRLEILKNIGTLFETFHDREALQNHSLIHSCMLDYSQCLVTFSKENEKIKILKEEFFSSLREIVPFIAHTCYGCQLANQIIWAGSAKDRKVIIKALQKDDKVSAMLKNKYASIVILCLLDSVDDTRLLNTAIVDKVAENFKNVAFIEQNSDDIHCKKIIHYICSGRKSLHKESIRKWLTVGDEITTSKKDAEIRQKEIFVNFAKKSINKYLKSASEILPFLIDRKDSKTGKPNNSAAVLLSDISTAMIRTGSASDVQKEKELIEFLENFLTLLIKDIELSASSFILRWIFKAAIEMSENKEAALPVLNFIKNKIFNEENVVKNWLSSNRGCFALVQVIEAVEKYDSFKEDLEKFKKTVKACIRHQGKKADSGCKGFEVLKGKI